jgi:DNA polymerase
MTLRHSLRPAPGALQKRWLAELGVDRYFLDHLSTDDTFVDDPGLAESPSQQSDPPLIIPGRPVASSPAINSQPPADLTQGAPALARQGGVLADTLQALHEQAQACEACNLHKGRGSVVFGFGHWPGPQWMLVSEAPTTDDDRAGVPFQGRAGALLQSMLAAAGINAQAQVYTTQLVKCRPLGNRPPQEDEISACSAYLRRQVALVKPVRLVALGELAARALYSGPESLEQLQGQVLHYTCESGRQIPLFLTHNPTALLTRPQHKLQAWRDLVFMRNHQVSQP